MKSIGALDLLVLHLKFDIRATLLLLASVVAAFACGCAPKIKETKEKLVEDYVVLYEDLMRTLESDVSREQLVGMRGRSNEIGRRLKRLNLSEEEKQRLMEKHADRMAVVSSKMLDMMMKPNRMENFAWVVEGVAIGSSE